MKRFWMTIFILFLIGAFLTVGGQPTEPFAEAIGDGVEGGLSFLSGVWDAITD